MTPKSRGTSQDATPETDVVEILDDELAGAITEVDDPKATPEAPRWFLVDVAFERKFKQVIALEDIRQHADALGEGFALTARGSRLSVFPVTTAQWKLLLGLEKP